MKENISRRSVIQGSIFLTGAIAAGADSQTSDLKPERPLKIVVTGAHPDDPESGCGGTIARFSQAGHEVTVLYLTRGEAGIEGKSHDEAAAIRTAEAEKACRILGAKPAFAGQIDGATEINRTRYEEYYGILMREKPDLCLCHWPIDTHRDHRVSALLAYDTWLQSNRAFTLYYYEVMSGHQSMNFQPTEYVDITATAEIKRQANYAHQSQNPEDFYAHHEAMNRFRGLEFGTTCAEAFILHAQSHQGMVVSR